MDNFKFKKYLKEELEDTLCQILQKDLEEDQLISDIDIRKLYLGDKDDLEFEGYMTILLSVESNDERPIYKYIRFEANFLDIKNTFKVIDIDDQYNKPNFKYPLNDNFIPYIKSEDEYEDYAKRFLNKYYPQQENDPFVNPQQAISNLKLTVVEHRLSRDVKVYARTIFEETELIVYDNDLEKKIIIPGNTIIMDPYVTSFYQDEGFYKSVLLHELVHFVYHKKYYYYAKRFLNINNSFVCNIEELPNDDTKWLEIQTNNIASKIMISANSLKNEIKNYKDENSIITIDDYVNFIDYLKNSYRCTYGALKVRLAKMGFNNTVGIYEYIDNRYVKPYKASIPLDFNETYSISWRDFMILQMKDSHFKQELDSNNYLFVENHVILNNSKYVDTTKNAKLTDYARNNINECCLKFKYTLSSNYDENYGLSLCKLHGITNFKLEYSNTQDINTEELIDTNEKYKNIHEIYEIIRTCDSSFTSLFTKVRKEQGITLEELEEYSTVSLSTIKRLSSIEKYKISKGNLTLICVGLQLPPPISLELFKRKSIDLNESIEENILCKDILTYRYKDDIDSVRKEWEKIIGQIKEDD